MLWEGILPEGYSPFFTFTFVLNELKPDLSGGFTALYNPDAVAGKRNFLDEFCGDYFRDGLSRNIMDGDPTSYRGCD